MHGQDLAVYFSDIPTEERGSPSSSSATCGDNVGGWRKRSPLVSVKAKGKKVVDEGPPAKKRKTVASSQRKVPGISMGRARAPWPWKAVIEEWSDNDVTTAAPALTSPAPVV